MWPHVLIISIFFLFDCFSFAVLFCFRCFEILKSWIFELKREHIGN